MSSWPLCCIINSNARFGSSTEGDRMPESIATLCYWAMGVCNSVWRAYRKNERRVHQLVRNLVLWPLIVYESIVNKT